MLATWGGRFGKMDLNFSPSSRLRNGLRPFPPVATHNAPDRSWKMDETCTDEGAFNSGGSPSAAVKVEKFDWVIFIAPSTEAIQRLRLRSSVIDQSSESQPLDRFRSEEHTSEL